MTEKRIMRLPAVIHATGMSRSSIYSYARTKKFPKQIRIGDRAVGWLESEIQKWVKQRVELRGVLNDPWA